MTRLGGGWQDSGKLYLRCEGCGNTAVMDMDATVNGIVRQFRDHEQPSCTAYTPSAEVMRLDQCHQPGAGAARLAGSGDGTDPAGCGSADMPAVQSRLPNLSRQIV